MTVSASGNYADALHAAASMRMWRAGGLEKRDIFAGGPYRKRIMWVGTLRCEGDDGCEEVDDRKDDEEEGTNYVLPTCNLGCSSSIDDGKGAPERIGKVRLGPGEGIEEALSSSAHSVVKFEQ